MEKYIAGGIIGATVSSFFWQYPIFKINGILAFGIVCVIMGLLGYCVIVFAKD